MGEDTLKWAQIAWKRYLEALCADRYRERDRDHSPSGWKHGYGALRGALLYGLGHCEG